MIATFPSPLYASLPNRHQVPIHIIPPTIWLCPNVLIWHCTTWTFDPLYFPFWCLSLQYCIPLAAISNCRYWKAATSQFSSPSLSGSPFNSLREPTMGRYCFPGGGIKWIRSLPATPTTSQDPSRPAETWRPRFPPTYLQFSTSTSTSTSIHCKFNCNTVHSVNCWFCILKYVLFSVEHL